MASSTELTGLVPGVGVIDFDVESDCDSGAQKLRVFILLLYSSYCFLVLRSRFEQFVCNFDRIAFSVARNESNELVLVT